MQQLLDRPRADHGRGDHRCVTYRGLPGRARAGFDFFGEGIGSDEKIVYVADGNIDEDPLADWLRASIEPDRLLLSHITDIYPASGSFDGPSTVTTFRELGASARSEGYSTIRAMADLTRLAQDAAVADDLLAYELLIDGTIEDEGFHGLCVYDRYGSGNNVGALCATHPAGEHTHLPTAWVRDGELRLGGELDLVGADVIADVLSVVPGGVRRVALDGLDFLDAAGARALWRFANERRDAGEIVEFTGATRTAQAVLSLYGLA